MLKSFSRKTNSLVNKLIRNVVSVGRPTKNLDNSNTNEYYIAKEYDYGCHNTMPISVVMKEGKGVYLWDVTGKRYFDFMSAYGAVNQGHCNEKILEAMINQAKTLTLTSSVTHHNQLGRTYEYISQVFGYDKTIFMNGGVEGSETAVLFARRWAYQVKGIPENKAKVIFPFGNYWGKTIAARAGTEDVSRSRQFGPFGGLHFDLVPYDDINALEEQFKSDPNIAAYLMEPIQGQGGINIPSEGYIKKVRELCTKYNILMVADEIQTGLGRTGKLYCCDWEGVKPDMLVLGKSLSGGFHPVSAVLANDNIMDTIQPGDHDTTYGGNPIAAAVTKRALEVLFEDKLIDNSYNLGKVFAKELKSMPHKFIKEVRAGKGLYAGMQFDQTLDPWKVIAKFIENGLIAKPTRNNTIRLMPPLVINEKELAQALEIIKKSLDTI